MGEPLIMFDVLTGEYENWLADADGGYVLVLAGGPTASTLDTMRVRATTRGCFAPAAAGDFPPGTDSQSVALGGQTLVMVVLGVQKETNSSLIVWNFQTLTVWRAALSQE